jgi:hypothetical protein
MTGLGFIRVVNAGNITLTATGKLKARGDFVKPNGFIIGGGLISLTSNGTIDIDGNIDVAGDSAGTIRLDAMQDILIEPGAVVDAPGNSSFADTGDRFTDGGELDALTHVGSITINGDVTLSGQNAGTGGTCDLQAGANITMTRSIDCSGGGGDGGEFSATAGDNISLTNGTINADSTVGGGCGGLIEFDAGEDFLGGTLPGGTSTSTPRRSSCAAARPIPSAATAVSSTCWRRAGSTSSGPAWSCAPTPRPTSTAPGARSRSTRATSTRTSSASSTAISISAVSSR